MTWAQLGSAERCRRRRRCAQIPALWVTLERRSVQARARRRLRRVQHPLLVTCLPRCSIAITEHSRCQPGAPGPRRRVPIHLLLLARIGSAPHGAVGGVALPFDGLNPGLRKLPPSTRGSRPVCGCAARGRERVSRVGRRSGDCSRPGVGGAGQDVPVDLDVFVHQEREADLARAGRQPRGRRRAGRAGGGSEAREVASGIPIASAQASACDEAFPERALVGTYAGAQTRGPRPERAL